MTENEDVAIRLAQWLATQLPNAGGVRIEGLDRSDVGHSAETLLFTLVDVEDGVERRRDLVARLRPPDPWLLPPYDLGRQVRVLRALEPTSVRAPRVFWYDAGGAAIGRELYVMERVPGAVYEGAPPDDATPGRVGIMCRSLIEQVAAMHLVDIDATGLREVADGEQHLEREFDHWEAEIHRVRRGPLPALERLVSELTAAKPKGGRHVTLVHGDVKSGNFAFAGTEVSGVFDWEMATVGDPLTDIGYAETLWSLTGVTALPGAPSPDEFVRQWEEITGFAADHRAWYRGFALMKLAAISLVGGWLFDTGQTDDPRFYGLGHGARFMVRRGLPEVGVTEKLEMGPIDPLEDPTRRN